MPNHATVADTLVRITVHPPVAGGTYTLSYFPKRRLETTVYFTPDGGPWNPDLPREVHWEAIGLQAGQTLEIEQKAGSGGQGRLKRKVTIVAPATSCRSGPVEAGLGAPPRIDSWAYSIILRDAAGRELARLDPEIIIIEDP